jgi:hypothetical protein
MQYFRWFTPERWYNHPGGSEQIREPKKTKAHVL